MEKNNQGSSFTSARHLHPLENAATPYYLQRFLYHQGNQTVEFNEADEHPAASSYFLNLPPAKRGSAEGEEPAPKRRERVTDDEIDQESQLNRVHNMASLFEDPDYGTNRTPEIFAPYSHLPASGLDHERNMRGSQDIVPPVMSQDGTPQPINSSHGSGTAPSAADNSDVGTTPLSAMLGSAPSQADISVTQPSLLSPTASPRPLASPQASDLDDLDDGPNTITTDLGRSPSLSVPGAAGPLSNFDSRSSGTELQSPLALDQYQHSNQSHQHQVQQLQLQLQQHQQLWNTFLQPRRFISQRPPFTPQNVTLHDEIIRDQMRTITDSFQSLPPAMHRYTLFKLLKMCDRNSLSALHGEIESSLRFDLLASFPLEVVGMVLGNLDVKSVIAAAEVSSIWYNLIEKDENLWQNLAEKECLHATYKDVEMARNERWGYTGWATMKRWPATRPVNVFGAEVNVHKAVFRRLSLIHQNWMRDDVEPRRYVIQCPNHEVITCLDFSDDIIIASTEGKRHLNIYDTETGVLLHEFTNHEGGVWALKRVNKDMIVSGSTDHTVRVWSLRKKRCTHVFRGHNATVRCLDVVQPIPGVTKREHAVILTGSRDTTMRMWRMPEEGDEDYDSRVAFIDQDNPYYLAELRGHQESVRAVCGYGNVAVSGSYDHRVRVWDLEAMKCRHELKGHEEKVYAATIDPDRNRCISASMDTNVIVWDLDTGSQLYKLHGHTGLVGLISLKDNTLVSAAADKNLRIWDPDTGELRHTLMGHNTAILCFVHDGRKVVSGSERHLKLWDSRTGEFARDLLAGVELIWQVSIDRRRCVAAISRDRRSCLEIMDFDFDRTQEYSIVESEMDEGSSIVEVE